MTDFDRYDEEALDELVIDLKLDEATTINNAGREAQAQYVKRCLGETTTREEDLVYMGMRLYLMLSEFCGPPERNWALDLMDNFGVPWTDKLAERADDDHREFINR